MTLACRTCGSVSPSPVQDLGTAAYCVQMPGTQAVARQTPRHPFRLRECPACGTLELADYPPLSALRPIDRGILYRDPERHLDDLARVIAPQIPSTESLILGMTYKDAPLLEALRTRGCARTQLLDRRSDWTLDDDRDGIETIQQRCTVAWADTIRERHGAVGLLVVRHLIEHAHDLNQFLAACRRLVEPEGLVLFEVPGCETELARGDSGALWEEHVRYFTTTSLRRALTVHGFQSLLLGNYPYTVEDCLVALCRLGPSKPAVGGSSGLLDEFLVARQRLDAALRRLVESAGPIAVYGAGHRAATWLDLSGLGAQISCVIDDDPAKQGRFLAGSGCEIGPSAWLVERNVRVCVGLLAPDVLLQIARREVAYRAAGGVFLTLDDVVPFTRSAS